jgi:Fungal specific transcription factor domain
MSRRPTESQNTDHKTSSTRENLQLRFITSTGPAQTKNESTRRTVRSHAARKVYRDRRQEWQRRETILHLDDPGEERAISAPSPLALVGQGTLDPFKTYPIPPNRRVNILVDHFLSFVGPGLTAFLTSDTDGNPMTTVYLPFTLVDPCVFSGLLMLSACSYARQSGDKTFNFTALEYKSKCMGMINMTLQNPATALGDAVIAAVMMLAVQEVCYLVHLELRR